MTNKEVFDLHFISTEDFKEAGKSLYHTGVLLSEYFPGKFNKPYSTNVYKAINKFRASVNMVMIFHENKLESGSIDEDMLRRRIAMGYRMDYIMLQEELLSTGYNFSIDLDMEPDSDKPLLQRISVSIGRKKKDVRTFTLEELNTLETLEGEVE